MREFIVDLTNVKSLDEFAAAFDLGFCRHVGGGGSFHKLNLDAFHDYLYWPDDKPYRLVFRGWRECAAVLSAIHQPSGKSYAEQLTEVFADNPQAQVVLD